MKKIIVFLLTLVLLVTPLTSLAAEAPQAASFLEGPAEVATDKEFEVTYYLQGDEIRAADGKINFNLARVDLVSVDLDAAGWIIEYEAVDDGILFAVANETGKRPVSEKTAIFTVTLRARTTTGTVGISASYQNVANGKSEMVALEDTAYVDPNKAPEGGDDNQGGNQGDNQQGGSQEGNQGGSQGGNQGGNQGGTVIVPPTTDGPSSDFTLKKLDVKGYKLIQKDGNAEGFDPEVRNYVLTVPFSVEKLEITAEANDANAQVEITEAELIYVGTNITKIAVTAEDGSKRTYKIYTTRLAPEDEGEDEEEDANNEEESAGIPWWIWVVIGGAVLLIAIIIIVIVILKKKKN